MPAKKKKMTTPKEPQVVAECVEFTLYSDGRVVSSKAVDLALMRSCFRINKRTGDDERLELVWALWQVMELAAGHFKGNPDDLLDSLSNTLGEILLSALNNSDGAERRALGASKKIGKAVNKIETASLNLARFRSSRPMPGDKSLGAWTWILQLTAKEVFRETKLPPRKSSIREMLEADGWGFVGHASEENWIKKFRQAGLENLPN